LAFKPQTYYYSQRQRSVNIKGRKIKTPKQIKKTQANPEEQMNNIG